MAYADMYLGKDTPKLGFGLMRLPRLEDGSMDLEQVCQMVDTFMDAGLTYFDTAFVYDNGESERVARRALVERYPRESYTMATKANAWLGSPTEAQTKAQITTSLERLGLDYVDYYLLHAIQKNNVDQYDAFGMWDFVRDLKRQGIVRHWGFSYHWGPEALDELLTKHPDVDFIQLQINYADWEDPGITSRANAEVAQAHGVPFVIMEPIKGGTLATPPEPVRAVFDEAAAEVGADPAPSYASWAVRFAASQPGVIAVLSGMSTLAQVEDNVGYMRQFSPLDERELAVIAAAQEALASIDQVRCTACHYCTDGCPMHIDIPGLFKALNRLLVYGDEAGARRDYAFRCNKAGSTAADCIACGQCEGACPQGLPIISLLQRVDELLA